MRKVARSRKKIPYVRTDREYWLWRSITGKPRICDRLLEVYENLHMGYTIGNSGHQARPRPAEPHLYYTTNRAQSQDVIQTKFRFAYGFVLKIYCISGIIYAILYVVDFAPPYLISN